MTDQEQMSKADLLQKIEEGWQKLHGFAHGLTEEQLTTNTDAAGWTVKDHLMHLAVWEDSINALLNSISRRGYMGIDEETWNSRDFDKINAIIQTRYKDKSVEEVLNTLTTVHQKLVDRVQAMSDDELRKPYSHYQPDSTADAPVVGWIVGDTYEHYEEHRPWMDYILAQKPH